MQPRQLQLSSHQGLMLPTAAITTPLFASLGCFRSHSAKFHPPFPCVLVCSWQGHCSRLPAPLSLVLGHQLCVKIASVLHGIGQGCCPRWQEPFEWRRTQVTIQHRSFWQSDSYVGTVPGKASTPPPCTTIRFPDLFSVQLLIPVMAWSRFCFSSHCKWTQKATHRAVLSWDTAMARIKCLSPEDLTRAACHFAQ